MGSSTALFSTLLSLSLVDTVLSYAQCGALICSGYSAYCCSFDLNQCCYYYVYHFWWFWFVWVIIFTLIASCSICCYRRRRRQYYRSDYGIVTDGYRPPAYGTVVAVSSAGAPPPYPQQATAPPQYQPEQKPPAYVP